MIYVTSNSSDWPTQKALEELAEKEVKEIAGTIFRTAVKLSPVYSGAFRASWRISFNELREDVTEGRPPPNARTIRLGGAPAQDLRGPWHHIPEVRTAGRLGTGHLRRRGRGRVSFVP